MKKKTLFATGVIIGSVSFWGISCISRNPQAAATYSERSDSTNMAQAYRAAAVADTERSDSMNMAQAYQAAAVADTERSDSMNMAQAYQTPEVIEFVPEEWSKNSRLQKLLTTDFYLRESAKRVRKMLILPDTMDGSLLDLSPYNSVFAPDKGHKLIFPTNSTLSVTEDTAKGTAINAAVADSIFRADEKHSCKIMRARGFGDIYRERARNVDYSLIGSVNLSPGVKSYIVSSIRRESDRSSVSSTALYLVNCVDDRIISMLQLAEDWSNGLGAMMKQAYRIPAPAGSDIILTKMMSYPLDLEPFDDNDISITYSAYKLNDSGELHRIYKPK